MVDYARDEEVTMLGRPRTTPRTLNPHSFKCCLVAIIKSDAAGLYIHSIKIATDNVPSPKEMEGGLWCIIYMSSGSTADEAMSNLVRAVNELAPRHDTWKTIKDLLSDPDHPDHIYFVQGEN